MHLTDDHGFVQALCPVCERTDVWLTCNSCGASDRFEVTDGQVRCSCGQTYAFATCTCGAEVPAERLRWVPWRKGPASLADWEANWRRVALLAVVLLILVGGGVAVALTLL